MKYKQAPLSSFKCCLYKKNLRFENYIFKFYQRNHALKSCSWYFSADLAFIIVCNIFYKILKDMLPCSPHFIDATCSVHGQLTDHSHGVNLKSHSHIQSSRHSESFTVQSSKATRTWDIILYQ